MNTPRINERKTTEAAAVLIELEGGNLEYMKLVKLLYNIDREALRRWARPITFDVMYSLPQGQILSGVLNMAKERWSDFWNAHIQNTDKYHLEVAKKPDLNNLSLAEQDLVKEIQAIYVGWNGQDMGQEHKDPSKFPEYVDPKGGRIQTDYERLLKLLGYSDQDLTEIAEDYQDIIRMESVEV